MVIDELNTDVSLPFAHDCHGTFPAVRTPLALLSFIPFVLLALSVTFGILFVDIAVAADAGTVAASDTDMVVAADVNTAEGADDEKTVLFINSYDYGFETVPVVSGQVAQKLKGHATIQYLSMNEKYEDDVFASSHLTEELDYLTSRNHYDVVLVGDDAAFDYLIAHRDKYFADTPVIFENVNGAEKVTQYAGDAFVTGVVELFPMRETIETAREVMPKARRVVTITDRSVSAAGSLQQVMDEKSNFPDLEFETFDCSKMTADEMRAQIAQYGDDTILLYTVFNIDSEGNRYTVSQGVKLLTDAARVPIFKADEAGFGDGLIGGYMLSYESVGKQTADLVLAQLSGQNPCASGTFEAGECRYAFDVAVMNKYGITKSKLPKGSTYINEPPSFFERFGLALSVLGIAAMCTVLAIIGHGHMERRRMQKELAEHQEHIMVEEASNLAKTDFISRMSHDIRTPLNVMLGMNDLARQSIHNSDVALNYLDKSRSSEEMLLALVNDILDISKIEQGKMELDCVPCSLTEIFETIGEMFQPLCDAKHIEFKTENTACDKTILTDSARLNQIFCNLLSNAVKFTPEGGVVSFLLHCTDKLVVVPKRQTVLACTFVVSDTGCGMSEEFQTKMFDAFTQEAIEASSQGSGLGLRIVKNVVELMGGTVEVKSKSNEGTTVSVKLDFPIVDSSAVTSTSPADKENVQASIAGLHVLVVEDNELNAEVVSIGLENAGAIVSRAENGRIAVDMIDAAADGDYDVVLMDNRMPVLSGIDATREIRAMNREWTRTLPIIAMSADIFVDDVRHFKEAGMDASLSKPIDTSQMFSKIAELCSESQCI